MTCWTPNQGPFSTFLIPLIFVGVVSVGPMVPKAEAKQTCGKVFVTSERGRSKSRPNAQKQARQRVRERARKRCQGGRLIYMRRWSYKCSTKRKRASCLATNAFRCCGARKVASASPPPARLQVKRTQGRTLKSITIKPPQRSSSQPPTPKPRIIKVHRRTHAKHKKGVCSHTFAVREHGRGFSKRNARANARVRTRRAIAKRCNALRVIWMKRWTYRCKQLSIRARRVHTICEAQTAIRCCDK